MITSAVVSAWLWVHVGVLCIVVAYAACGHAFFPTIVERGRERLASRPVRTALIGALVSVPWLLVAILLSNAPLGGLKLAGAILGLAWIAVGLAGLGSIALHVGERGAVGGAAWTTVARGAGFLALTWMLPILGWFVMLPLSLVCGVGCVLGGLRSAPMQPTA